MPHQCLKCGNVFPSGSPEILKGCNECGGKKFFYTEQPVSETERERLTEQANKDIKVLIREVLSQAQHEQLKTYDSEGREVPSVTGEEPSDWVKITPQESARGEPGIPEITPIKDKEVAKLPTVKKILEELKKKPEIGLELTGKGKVEEVVEKPTIPAVEPGQQIVKTRPRKKGKVKLKRRYKAGKKKRPARPEVIRVEEPGVYDINLVKLLKGFPIIINRDGTYLVHLPSVFETMEKEKKE